MIVTAGAGDGHPQKGFGKHIDLVVSKGHQFIERVGRVEAVRHHSQLADAEGAFVDLPFAIDTGVGQQITGDLLSEELVNRQVRVDGPDAPVTELPGMGNCWVAFTAVGLAIADTIKPVPRPAFGKGGRVDQSVDQAGPAIGPLVL